MAKKPPSYRRHVSGQARVTINGKDHFLGRYGSSESRQEYSRLIAEYEASGRSPHFGKRRDTTIEMMLAAFVRHIKVYHAESPTERANFKLAIRPFSELYGQCLVTEFGPAQFMALRQWWCGEDRTRQYVNKMAKRTRAILKWAVSAGLFPADQYTAIGCIGPLKKGKCDLREATPVLPVSDQQVDDTLPHLTPVLSDMVQFQRLTGCRPGELCKLTPGMVQRDGAVWEIHLAEHKTAHHDHSRIIYVGPQAQAVLRPYLLRAHDQACFSPRESEEQRRAAAAEQRTTPANQGNRRGYSRNSRLGQKPRREPGVQWTTRSYSRAIESACLRGKVKHWSPNQLRHAAATRIRKEFGLEAAQVILGHSKADVTQVYAERDRVKAIEVAATVG